MAIIRDNADHDQFTYFKNNKEGVSNLGEKWNIGVSAGSDVSRLVKSLLGYGSRTYSIKTFLNMLWYRSYKINNFGTF
ncbi:hypothetical protein [Mesoplasma seiffertii]|uniref:hypothetical protein n=1 Tax=Mesoplasma seiffertii TaxID=28224 RepID=UPI00047DDA94|nr:hypothetical protein [Mesoplasma seiffertii]